LNNTDFKYGIIYANGETKKLNIYTQNDSVIVSLLDSSLIAKYQSNIDTLLYFYSMENRNDTIKNLNNRFYLYDLKNKKSVENKSVILDNDAIEKSAYEGRRKMFLRTRALERGLTGQDLIDAQNYGSYGEIKFKKKKK